jgi:hypothetical protein
MIRSEGRYNISRLMIIERDQHVYQRSRVANLTQLQTASAISHRSVRNTTQVRVM